MGGQTKDFVLQEFAFRTANADTGYPGETSAVKNWCCQKVEVSFGEHTPRLQVINLLISTVPKAHSARRTAQVVLKQNSGHLKGLTAEIGEAKCKPKLRRFHATILSAV